jgi:outer membrane lipoprotein
MAEENDWRFAMKRFLLLIPAALLAACNTVPKPLQGQFSPILPDAAATSETNGQAVRWGGNIVSVDPQSQRTCFEIVAAPLYSSGRPRDVDVSAGRFLACRAGFYDPEVFQAGRQITISGRIDGFEMRKVGEFDYRYPRVAADVVYLWPVRRDVDVIVTGPSYYGWGGMWGGWYGRRW